MRPRLFSLGNIDEILGEHGYLDEASMRPRLFSLGNFVQFVPGEKVCPASMRPRLFSLGNAERE